jgi:hypothetical protein
MRLRSLAFATPLAVVLAFVMATTALGATSFKYRVLRDVCTLSGGSSNLGYVVFKVKVKEIGTSGANYFRIKSKAQYQSGSNKWHTAVDWGWEYSNTFPNDSGSYYHVLKRRYDMSGVEDATRIKMKVQVWSNSKGLLSEKIMTSQVCVSGLP